MANENQAPTRKRTSITIYASGRALVQGCYALRLAEGKNTFALEGMPAQFVPSSLYADQFEGPGEVTMGPITYRAANLNTANQLARSLNREVTVVHGGNLPKEQDEVTGILLSYQGTTALVRITDGIHKGKIREVRNVQSFIYPELSDGLANTPALDFAVEASAEGDYEATLLFATGGLRWNPDYKLIYDEVACRVRWDGSIFVTNGCGASFEDAELTCAAGDAGDEGGALEAMHESAPRAMAMAAPVRSKGVRQASVESLGNVKLYGIPGRITLADGSSPKVPFFAADDVPVRREYRLAAQYNWFLYNGEQEAQFGTVLMLKNDEANKLGKPLPGGPVEVLQRDSSGCLRQTGGARLDDVAVSEEFELEIGNDFDLKAKRRVLKVVREVPPLPPAKIEPVAASEEGKTQKKEEPKPRKVIYTRHCQIEITSGKKEDTGVVIAESLPENCELIDAGGLKEKTARNFVARGTVPACGKVTIDFIVRQTAMERVSDQEAAEVDGRGEPKVEVSETGSEPEATEALEGGGAQHQVAFGEALSTQAEHEGFGEVLRARPAGRGPLE